MATWVQIMSCCVVSSSELVDERPYALCIAFDGFLIFIVWAALYMAYLLLFYPY